MKMNKCKDDLVYSANHVYREGYNAGEIDGIEIGKVIGLSKAADFLMSQVSAGTCEGWLWEYFMNVFEKEMEVDD